MGARGARGAGSLLLVVALVLGIGAPQPVAAQDRTVDAATAAALARRAVDDDRALAELRALQTVDGRPVDLEAATADLGADRARRLEGLALALGDGQAAGGAETSDVDAARSSARSVLDDDKFQPTELPRPFRKPLELLARVLRPVGRGLDRILRPVLDLPGGPYILAAVLAAAAASLVAWLIGRRSRAAVERQAALVGLVDPAADPDDLERRAEAAERDGQLGPAVRLRYEAGLLRLVRAERLVLRPDTTAADAARQVGSPHLDALTVVFEEVVYGGRDATADDVAAARTGWLELLGAGARR